MYYRVVLQGRTLSGADIAEVKRQFVRVTGLPARVAEQLFGGMPKVIKRQVPQTDAERIAATLRAIGAAATVERELPGTEDETPEGIRVLARPLNAGPPTIIPGMEPLPEVAPTASRHGKLLRAVLARWTWLAGGIVLVAGAILLAPVLDDILTNQRRTPARAQVVPARAPAPPNEQSAPVVKATLIHGPWRCTNQRTGVSTYWSYGAEGALVFHGDALSDRPAPGNSGPTGWKLGGGRLFHTFAQREPEIYTVDELTLSRLRYGDERDFVIECRRP